MLNSIIEYGALIFTYLILALIGWELICFFLKIILDWDLPHISLEYIFDMFRGLWK